MCACVRARENEWSVYVMCVHMCICKSGGVVCMHVCGREYGGGSDRHILPTLA